MALSYASYRVAFFSLCLTTALMSACLEADPPTPKEERGDEAGDHTEIGQNNRAPKAIAGADRLALVGEELMLDGSGSFDPNQDGLSYAWTLQAPQGALASLQDADRAVARLTPDRPGAFIVSLTVSDGELESEPASFTITVTAQDIDNAPPQADAGVDRQVALGQPVTLDGARSQDPDGDPLTYAWSLVSAPEGSQAQIMGVESMQAVITPEIEGMYRLRLIVSDGMLGSNPALVTLTAVAQAPLNQAPVARQAPDQNAEVGDQVTLDGTLSQDPDGDPITYRWELDVPAKSSASLSAPTAAKPTFTADVEGVYTARLTVEDDAQVESEVSASRVTVAQGNLAPEARVGMARDAVVGEEVALDGGSSQDPDGDALSFMWTLSAKPSGSNASLQDASSATPTLKPDVAGTYIAELIVSDGELESTPASVIIEVIQACVLISEYIEGSSYNKAAEFYNCSGATLSLRSVRVCLFSNDDTSCDTSRPMPVSELPPGGVTAICDGQASADLKARCNQHTSSAASFNGDDRLVVFLDLDGDGAFDQALEPVLDAFGPYAMRPASSIWKDVTYRRCSATPYDGQGAFAALSYFTQEPVDTFDHLGVAPLLQGCP